MSNVEKPKVVVDVAKITKIINEMLENDKIPDVFIETHQLAMVFSLLFEKDPIGVHSASIAYHVASFLKYNDIDIDPTFEDLAKITMTFKQKLEQLSKEMMAGSVKKTTGKKTK